MLTFPVVVRGKCGVRRFYHNSERRHRSWSCLILRANELVAWSQEVCVLRLQQWLLVKTSSKTQRWDSKMSSYFAIWNTLSHIEIPENTLQNCHRRVQLYIDRVEMLTMAFEFGAVPLGAAHLPLVDLLSRLKMSRTCLKISNGSI